MAGLIDSYSSANRVIDEDLCITYAQTRAYGEWSVASGTSIITYHSMWNFTRTATKRYKYVGMTKTAADTCATAIRAIYQRSFKVSEWNPANSEFSDINGGGLPMASVAVSHVGGDMWQVDISVNETDSRTRRVPPSNVESLFSAENARDYDTGA